jgi:5-formyltetrahydrofolate cyclo-ligase
MNDVAAWRKARRAELIVRREAIPPALRREWSAALEQNLRAVLADQAPAILSFYWPFRGEFDARPLVRELLEKGWRAALPVVLEKKKPMQFRLWTPDAPMVDGIWQIPVPRDGAVVVPDVVLAPLVGFDEAGYRLGYGGGYFDRTLATLTPRPLAIGVGFELGRLASIEPQPLDQRFDAIVTEAAIRR